MACVAPKLKRLRSVVVGLGAYLPERCMTNQDLEKLVDTSDDWIVQRTGIRQRHFSKDSLKSGFSLTSSL